MKKYENETIGFTKFKNYKIVGSLKKMADKTDFLLGIRFLKRNCIIDYVGAKFIMMKKDLVEDSTNIQFRDILSCYRMEDESKLLKICSKTFCFPFVVETRDRSFVLFATSEDERQLWMYGFDYVICSTN